jgi:hypothetical protein
MRFALVWASLLALALAACGDLKQNSEDAQKSEVAIKSELGLDSKIGFRSFSGTNGSRTTVVVHLAKTPSGDVTKLKADVTDIVSRTFHAHVDQVTLDF